MSTYNTWNTVFPSSNNAVLLNCVYIGVNPVDTTLGASSAPDWLDLLELFVIQLPPLISPNHHQQQQQQESSELKTKYIGSGLTSQV